MCGATPHAEDSQDVTRIKTEHETMLELLAKRQKASISAYALPVVILDAVALFVWGVILRDAQHAPPEPVTVAYAASLTAATVLALCAITATAVWILVGFLKREAAERDRIIEYQTKHHKKRLNTQVDAIADAVHARIRQAEHDARQTFWERKADEQRQAATGTGPPPRRHASEAGNTDPSPVLQFPTARQPPRSS